jgi:heme oxygenase (biliverdin-IX-beta and delta-forming)
LSFLSEIAQPLALRLRNDTDAAHRSLEEAIGFDLHQPSRDVALAMLRGFWRVLRVLEPPTLRLLPPQLAEGRDKLALLHRDLRTLGADPSELDAASAAEPIWLPQTADEALGVFYVTEGSTLGGKVITKALRRLPDWPITSPSYLDPYGAETGARWLQFQAVLADVPADRGDAVIEAASRTFALMERCFRHEARP